MNLARAWRARVAGGVAAAVVAPAAIIGAALAVGLFGGGIGGVGQLGQAFAGPTPPAIEPQRDSGGRSAQEGGRLLASAINSRRVGIAPAAVRERRLELRRRARETERRRRRRGARRPSTGNRRPRPTPTAAPTSTPAPTPPPEPPSTIRQVGDQAKDVVDDAPVAGEPAAETIELVVETVEESPLPEVPAVPVPQLPLP